MPGCRLSAAILHTKGIIHTACSVASLTREYLWDLKIIIFAEGCRGDAVILSSGLLWLLSHDMCISWQRHSARFRLAILGLGVVSQSAQMKGVLVIFPVAFATYSMICTEEHLTSGEIRNFLIWEMFSNC